MKTPKLTPIGILAALVSLTSPGAHAQGGSTGSHGGDAECENYIKSLIAPAILKWVRSDGGRKLDLSSSRFPGTTQPYTYAQYKAAMEKIIPGGESGQIDQARLRVSCVSLGDRGFPVEVKRKPKLCVSSVSRRDGGLDIKCDFEKIVGASGRIQFEQIHHEFATNVEGLEPDYDDGSISNFSISEQISRRAGFMQKPVLQVEPSDGEIELGRDRRINEIPPGSKISFHLAAQIPADCQHDQSLVRLPDYGEMRDCALFIPGSCDTDRTLDDDIVATISSVETGAYGGLFINGSYRIGAVATNDTHIQCDSMGEWTENELQMYVEKALNGIYTRVSKKLSYDEWLKTYKPKNDSDSEEDYSNSFDEMEGVIHSLSPGAPWVGPR